MKALTPPNIVLLARYCDTFKFLPLKKTSAAFAKASNLLESGNLILLPAIDRASDNAVPLVSKDLPISSKPNILLNFVALKVKLYQNLEFLAFHLL